MNTDRLDTLLALYFDDSITEAELRELDTLLQTQPTARRAFRREAQIHGALREWGQAEGDLSVLQSAPSAPEKDRPETPNQTPSVPPIEHLVVPKLRSALQIAASLAIGAILSSVVWSYSSRATSTIWTNQTIPVDQPSGTPTELPLPAGPPLSFGVLSGDPASWTLAPDGSSPQQVLRFIQAGADAAGPSEIATSCDVFQLIDLTNIPRDGGETLLQVSLQHADFSPSPTPSLRFGCRIFTFEGCPSEIMTQWPRPMEKALSSAAAYMPPGLAHHAWKTLTAKATVPPTAQFAVIQLVASDISPKAKQPAIFGSQYARDIQIRWKRIPTPPNTHLAGR
jgi:hypothetical protein